MIFKILYISQPRTVISQKCKINEMSPATILAHYLECFQITVQGRKTQSETSGFPELHRWKREYKNTKVARVYRKESLQGEIFIQRELWKYTECQPQVFSWVLIRACMRGKYLGPGKALLKRMRENRAWPTNRARSSACSH